MHYYNRNLGDYAKKAGRLSMLQHGAYTLLLDACYDRERFPTLDEAIEWTWASTAIEIEAVEFVLRKFFVLENGVYVQKRVEQELNEYREKAETNRRIAIEREAKKKQSQTIRAEENQDRARVVQERAEENQDREPNQEPITNNQEPITNNQVLNTNTSPQAADKFSDSMIAIFDHWKKIMNHPKAKLDNKRKKLITAALKLGYSETELITAVNGCAKSPYHMAQDGRNTTVYDDIELILRDAKHIDQFLKINSMPPAPMANQPKFNPVDYINRNRASSDAAKDFPAERLIGNAN